MTSMKQKIANSIELAYYNDTLPYWSMVLLFGREKADGLKVFKERQRRDYVNGLEDLEE